MPKCWCCLPILNEIFCISIPCAHPFPKPLQSLSPVLTAMFFQCSQSPTAAINTQRRNEVEKGQSTVRRLKTSIPFAVQRFSGRKTHIFQRKKDDEDTSSAQQYRSNCSAALLPLFSRTQLRQQPMILRGGSRHVHRNRKESPSNSSSVGAHTSILKSYMNACGSPLTTPSFPPHGSMPHPLMASCECSRWAIMSQYRTYHVHLDERLYRRHSESVVPVPVSQRPANILQ